MPKTTLSNIQIITRQKGFSLLEAVVAIAIMAGAGMAIFGWINTNLVTITKIENRAFKDQLIRSASEYMLDIDIMERQNGQAELSGYTVSWDSVLVEQIKEGRNKTGALSEFQLGLFDARVKLERFNQEVVAFDIRLVGYKKVRNSQDGI